MIENRDALEASPVHKLALDCLEAAVGAATPETATREAVSLDGETLSVGERTYDLSAYDRVLVVGGGKAAAGVTRALESVLGDRISDGLVVSNEPMSSRVIETVQGDHPIPSQTNVDATADLLAAVDDAGASTLVFAVVTGGGSAMLAAPAGDLTIDDLQETTDALLKGGVPIEGINAVRKHLSAIKGGSLARRAAPATVIGLVVSDVVGNDLSTIASGPTVPDETTYEDALAVFDRYDVTPPSAVAAHLHAGADGEYPETPSAADDAFGDVHTHIVADNRVALDAARDVARASNYEPLRLTSSLRGEASAVAKPLVAIAEEVVGSGSPVEPPAVILAGGETTVTVADDPGSGGPNQELVLSAALEPLGDVVIAAMDSDGYDGSSDVAGAIADRSTVTDADAATAHLSTNDAGSYLSAAGATIHTGATGTNVNDLVVIVIPATDEH